MADHSYTLEEAAAKIGIREDTLTAMLPGIGFDLTARSPLVLTEAEFNQLAEEHRRITGWHDKEGGNY